MFNFNVLFNQKDNLVMHDFINRTFMIDVPHEWYFLNLFLKYELVQEPKLVYPFIMFIKQYYPKYNWRFFTQINLVTSLASVTAVSLECDFCLMIFEQKYLRGIKEENFKLTQAMAFGAIVTDFLIRYKGYSLIGCSKESIIITAHSDCHKRFLQYLSKGYSLERKAKVVYTGNMLLPEPYGYFYKLPVLPTKDMGRGYPIDEIIEDSEGIYRKVLNKEK